VVKARRDGDASHVIDDFGSSGIADAGYILSYFFAGTSDDLVHDKDVTALIEAGNTTNDPEVRKKSYGDAEQTISEQA
jgi:peptide/nickel transport system substrate-binding protein